MTHEIDTRLRALERAVVELLTDRHIQEARHPNTTTQSPGWWAEARGMIRAAIPAHSDAAPAEPTPAAPATRWWVCDNAGEAFMASLVVTLPTGEAKRLGELAAEGGLIQPLHGRLLLGSGEARRG